MADNSFLVKVVPVGLSGEHKASKVAPFNAVVSVLL
jgi:hypothetical protein